MKNVLKYFEEIMQIPRESGKEEKIADYLINYAKKNNITYRLGKFNTVFLKKNNHSNKTIILQAHSDMVCVATDDYDFDNKGIPFYIDGDYYKAKNTSLGADDGIGLALILAILQENENMPNIEVMITTQEETTMLGASNFDYSMLTGKTLISLDGIKEGDIESSSAGMCSLTFRKILHFEETSCNTFKLSISGLKGGHSGDDIDKKRCNAIKLSAKILNDLNYKEIVDIQFGKRDNVIPSEGFVIFSSDEDIEILCKKLNSIKLNLSEEDSNILLNLDRIESLKVIKDSKNIAEFITKLKDGLLETYQDDNFPLLSANIGKISVLNDILEIKYSIRSSDLSKEKRLLGETESLAKQHEFEMIIDAKKPFFPFKEKSIIRQILTNTYKKLYSKNITIKKVHACMEGGILSSHIEGLDICTIAPTIENCHSINECVSISSTKRVYTWLKETLIVYNQNTNIMNTSINNKDYEEISPTAIVTSYPRIFTDIPYEKEIYNWLESHCNIEVALYKNMAPEMEARYKLINKLLNKYNIKQVLELAAGYSSRGLIYSKNGYNYVEMDLENVSTNKKEILQTIEANIPKTLNIINGNALKCEDFEKVENYFNPNEKVAVINEGLLRYLTFEEKRMVAENIYALLVKHGGVWITSDLTPKKFIKSQNEAFQDFNKCVNTITSRNSLNDRFEDENHIREFFGNIGFELVEVHPFKEVKKELYSINTLDILDEKIEKTLEDAIVVVMKVK